MEIIQAATVISRAGVTFIHMGMHIDQASGHTSKWERAYLSHKSNFYPWLMCQQACIWTKEQGDTRGLLPSMQVTTQSVKAIMTSHCKNLTRTPGEYKRGNDFIRALYHNQKPVYVLPGVRGCRVTPIQPLVPLRSCYKQEQGTSRCKEGTGNLLQVDKYSSRCGCDSKQFNSSFFFIIRLGSFVLV